MPYVALVLFDREIVMKIWKVLARVVFTFLTLQCQTVANDSDDEIPDIWTIDVSKAVNFTAVWNDVKALKGPIYNKDFYHDYFTESARELYVTDLLVFSVSDGEKYWSDMILSPVTADVFLGTGTIRDDFPWLKEKNSAFQIIGYLSWLKDTNLENAIIERALNDLRNISKDGDTLDVHADGTKSTLRK